MIFFKWRIMMHLCLDQWAVSQANVFAQLYSFIMDSLSTIQRAANLSSETPAMALACSTYLKRITL